MKRTYVAAIETGDRKHSWGIVFPDVPGCFSAADSADDILPSAREALALHLETALTAGEPIPPSATLARIAELRRDTQWREFQEFVLVDVDIPEPKAVRVNITLPEAVLTRLDGYAKRTRQPRSAVLAKAAAQFIQT